MAVHQHDIPGTHYHFMPVPNIAAVDVTDYLAAWVAPYKLTLTKVQYMPTDAVTGVDTNSRKLNLDSGPGTAGTRTASLSFAAGTNGSAGVASAFTFTSGANLTLAADTVLRLESEKVGTGLALPAGVVVLQYTPA